MVKSTIINFNGTREKPGLAFLPRYICKKLHRHLVTKPLAGTIKINKMETSPAMISNFLKDPKENLEHQLAVEQILMDLKFVCKYEKWIIPSEKIYYVCSMRVT